MKTLATLAVLAFALTTFAQTTPAPPAAPNPSTTQPNFSLSVSFLGGSLGGGTNPGTDIAAEIAANKVFSKAPAGWYLRTDNYLIPGKALSGNFGDLQGPIPYISKFFQPNSFQAYMVGGLGSWRETVNTVTKSNVGYNVGGGLNYDPTGTGKFTLNLFEVRETDTGPIYATSINLGVF